MVLRGVRLLTEANRVIFSASLSFEALSPIEMSAPVSPAASGRTVMRCVTESGRRGARLRSIHTGLVQREAHLLPGRGGAERNTEGIQYTLKPLMLLVSTQWIFYDIQMHITLNLIYFTLHNNTECNIILLNLNRTKHASNYFLQKWFKRLDANGESTQHFYIIVYSTFHACSVQPSPQPTFHLSRQQLLSVSVLWTFLLPGGREWILECSSQERCDWWSTLQVGSAPLFLHNNPVVSIPEQMDLIALRDKEDSCL